MLTADPIYYIFADLLERLGFDVIAVPEDQHGIRTEHLQKTIESLGDKTHRAIRECAGNGVRALLRFEGHVPPEVLRALINDLKDLAERAAGYVSDVEDNSIETIRSLFPQVSDDPGGV